ncbi:MAG: hypothetical protein FWD09_05550 [Lentimicrobiaceae bacterium]|nr:hypothetical protein [Lentimicrobiaceae bacterium]
MGNKREKGEKEKGEKEKRRKKFLLLFEEKVADSGLPLDDGRGDILKNKN